MKGIFYGLGVGPGDPELLTLKAHRILQEADVLSVPVTKKEKESLALSIVAPHLQANKQVLELHMPMTQDATTLKSCWDDGADQILKLLQQGKNVAFLTLGDPSLFSTYTYLMKRIKSQDPEIKIETIPGITSLSAAAGRINVPLAEGEETLTIVPALKKPEDLRSILRHHDNVVLMKVSRQFPELVRVMKEEGRIDQAVMVTRCGQVNEKITTDLTKVVDDKIDYMSLIIIKGGC